MPEHNEQCSRKLPGTSTRHAYPSLALRVMIVAKGGGIPGGEYVLVEAALMTDE